MRPDLFTHVITFHEALARTMAAATPIERTERIAILDAIGRVAAADVHAPTDVPAFARSAMDGYALRSTDVAGASLAAPVVLTCVDRVATGEVSTRPIRPGECAEIGTGAPLPEGADAVVMVERTTRHGDRVAVGEATRASQNVGRRGADIAAGQPAIRRGDLIGAARAGALAAIGATSVDVFARPRVSMFSTGNEVVAPGEPLPPGHVHDVNSITLHAIALQHGGVPVRRDPVGDSIDALTEALVEASISSDIVVTSGGSSVGGRDLLIDAIARCGSVVFHGMAVKPGKPTLFGHVGETPLFGMPGNPTSCLSNAHILLVPFLRTVARLPLWQPVRRTLPLSRAIGALADRHQFYTVRIVEGRAEPAFKSSGDITSMAAADGYVEIPAGEKGFEEGERVTVVLF